MGLYEIEALIDNLWMKDKESWNQTRTIAYVTAQCQSTKKIEPQDLMSFPWDKQAVQVEDTPEELEALRREMKAMERKMNKK